MLKRRSASPSILLTPMGVVSALALISIIVSQFGAVHAQDYITAYEGSIFEEGSDSTGYGTILWRLRLSDTSASPGQTIVIFIDIRITIDYQYPVELDPIYVKEGETTTILVNTGILDQDVTMSCNEFVVAGLSYGEAIPNHFKGSGTTSAELLIQEHTLPGRCHFQAESEGWTPSNIVGLDVNQAGGTSTDNDGGSTGWIQQTMTTITWGTVSTIIAVTAGISLAGTGPLAEALANKPWSNTLREFLDKNLDLLMKWSRQAGTITQPTPRDDYVAYRDHLLEKYGTYRDWSTKLTQEEKDEYFERFVKNQEEIDAQNAKKSLTDWEAELKIPQDPKCESEQMQRIIWDSVKNDMKKGEIFDAGAEYRNRLMHQLDHDNPPDNITKVDDRYKRTSTSRRG